MLPENRSGTASGAPSALTWGAAPLRRRPPGRFRPFEPTPNPQPHCRRKSKFLSVFETLLLLVTCVWIIREAVERLFFKPHVVEASVWGFAVLVMSIVVDIGRSRALMRVAKKHQSQALEADALHFSTDVWSSSVVLAGLGFVSLSERLGVP